MSISAIMARTNARSALRAALRPPLKALRLETALPSGVLGPLDIFHGDQLRMANDWRERRSAVQPFAMLCLQ